MRKIVSRKCGRDVWVYMRWHVDPGRVFASEIDVKCYRVEMQINFVRLILVRKIANLFIVQKFLLILSCQSMVVVGWLAGWLPVSLVCMFTTCLSAKTYSLSMWM